jgi:putative transposase
MWAEAKEEVSHLLQSFWESHWRTIWSTNPLERVHHELKRRTNAVGVFPNDAAILALVTAVVLEGHEEWTVAERRYLQQESMATLLSGGPRRHHRAQARKRCCAPAPLQGFHRSLRQRLRLR